MSKSTGEAVQLLMAGSTALAQIEHNGMRIDLNYLSSITKEIKLRAASLEDRIRSYCIMDYWRKRFGGSTNIDSGPQLSHILYEHLGVPCTVTTEKGQPSTDEAALRKMDLPFVKALLEKRKLSKLQSTYLNNYSREHVNGYLHPSFKFTEPYRSSCSEPNLQNIPSRGPLAQIVRKCFIPRDGRVLVESDYASQEVRVAACCTKDPALIAYINDPATCMHRDAASDLFFLSSSYLKRNAEWTKGTVRNWAKNRFVFPQFYGSAAFQCAAHIWEVASDESNCLPNGKSILSHLKKKGITELGSCDPRDPPSPGTFAHHVSKVEDVLWNKRFTGYRDWKRSWWTAYCKEGGFFTPTGFYIHGVHKRNEVLNYPIQAAAFHCLLWDIIELQKEITLRKMKTVLVNEVHDSLVADVPHNELQEWLWLCTDVMVNRCMKQFPWLIVPLEVEHEVAETNWFDKKKWIALDGTWQPAQRDQDARITEEAQAV